MKGEAACNTTSHPCISAAQPKSSDNVYSQNSKVLFGSTSLWSYQNVLSYNFISMPEELFFTIKEDKERFIKMIIDRYISEH